ncbi:hypothetical protein JTB14_030077 [Gonioctena quinquepunctata]|nr:hypothetical protein JTB14_030077 [Gonioctena quinquepunctata]
MVISKDEESELSRKRAELANRLYNLTDRTGYEIIQTNGQRVYAPPASRKIKPPPKGCEVFIGKLNKNIFEDELIPLFEKIGPLYKFRMMLDFTEKTRGYAFATYFCTEDASKCIALLNDYEIKPRMHIGVYKSVDNCRLFIGNLPQEKKKSEVREMLDAYANGVVDLIMYPDYDCPWLNRGFVFVEFENHRLAAMARRQFTPDNLFAWGQQLYVDWADPVPDVDPRVLSKVTILYLRNLPADFRDEEIQIFICNVVGSHIVKKFHKNLNYAFVHFVNRAAAERAMDKLKNLIIGKHQIGVEWARPRRYSKKHRQSCIPENFCTSVPPSIRRLVRELKNGDSSRSSTDASEERPFKSRGTTTDELCFSFRRMTCSVSSPSARLSSSNVDTFSSSLNTTVSSPPSVPSVYRFNTTTESDDSSNSNDSVSHSSFYQFNARVNNATSFYANGSVSPRRIYLQDTSLNGTDSSNACSSLSPTGSDANDYAHFEPSQKLRYSIFNQQ